MWMDLDLNVGTQCLNFLKLVVIVVNNIKKSQELKSHQWALFLLGILPDFSVLS